MQVLSSGNDTLRIEFGIIGGMKCFGCPRPNVESEPEHHNAQMGVMEGVIF
jgi:hypothetical protein